MYYLLCAPDAAPASSIRAPITWAVNLTAKTVSRRIGGSKKYSGVCGDPCSFEFTPNAIKWRGAMRSPDGPNSVQHVEIDTRSWKASITGPDEPPAGAATERTVPVKHVQCRRQEDAP
jgi:hypothetical protein